MERTGVLRCPKEGGTTEELTFYTGRKADLIAKIDRATRAVNKKLPFGIYLPSAGCPRCHRAHELSKLIVDENCNQFERLLALVKEMEEAEVQGESAGDSGRKSQYQGAKNLLELYRAQDEAAVILMHGPFVPTEITTLLLYGRRESHPESVGVETSSSAEARRS